MLYNFAFQLKMSKIYLMLILKLTKNNIVNNTQVMSKFAKSFEDNNKEQYKSLKRLVSIYRGGQKKKTTKFREYVCKNRKINESNLVIIRI